MHPDNIDSDDHLLVRNLSPIALPRPLIDELTLRSVRESTVDPASGRKDSEEPATGGSKAGPHAEPRRPRGSVALFDLRQATAAAEAMRSGRAAHERASLQRKLLADLVQRGPWRRVATPGRDWQRELETLAARHPNASELIEVVAAQLALCAAAGRPPALPPLLLLGPPGVGKTVIAQSLCRLLRCPMHLVHVETAGHASSLVGVELHWASAGPGALYDALVSGDVINPAIVLDELEKVQQRDDYPSIHKALYGLLEPSTARNFHDACVPEVALDASHVRWIATCNSLRGIPEPILERMRVVRIGSLTPEHARHVVTTIDRETRDRYRLQRCEPLPQAVVDLLCSVPPRRMRLLLLDLYGRLALDSRDRVQDDDVQWLRQRATGSAEADSAAAAEKPPVIAGDDRALGQLLTMTNLAAFRALELRARIERAASLAWATARSDVIH